MAPKKANVNKKDLQKDKKKAVEDKTFGLKNKGKSKKVQQFVSQVERQQEHRIEQVVTGGKAKSGVDGGGGGKGAVTKKALLAARMKELEVLGQEVVDDSKKKKSDDQIRREAEEERKRQEEEEKLRVSMMPVEDQIEYEREKIEKKTPVTKELFMEWHAKKRKEREEKSAAGKTKAQTKAELTKGGTLTGKQLFELNNTAFVDDDAADDKDYERPEAYNSDDEKSNDSQRGENSELNDADAVAESLDASLFVEEAAAETDGNGVVEADASLFS
uniref:ZC3H15/TMA46 family C-terminal domain-containing protein n=1 Tax=Timspurckia oligopyrenoides TaxID=708627 RepID=A0A7S0ZKR3_9RHOD|mmetsp:Transcript_8321/g.15060  ORF Transcript_8321/g.15060 Transcript_8321/m.15060 type:complete len:274 (+) Transcript_8321:51-872(+)